MHADAGPLASVLLPFHNAAETIGDCVESILAQTLADFEVIAVDDFSTDDSAQILRDFDDPRIKIITNDRRGLVPALNTGLLTPKLVLDAALDNGIYIPNLCYLEQRPTPAASCRRR